MCVLIVHDSVQDSERSLARSFYWDVYTTAQALWDMAVQLYRGKFVIRLAKVNSPVMIICDLNSLAQNLQSGALVQKFQQ